MSDIYRFLLKQHIGKQAATLVVKGDNVRRGQPVAFQEENSLGAPVHSSVSGTVTDVTDTYIEVAADTDQSADYVPLTAKDPLALIKEAGIVGLGGAGFPTYAKLAKPFEQDGCVIINAAECEPILSHNIARIERRPEQVVRGLRIAMEITHASHGFIAIKAYHTEAIGALRSCLEPDMTIHELPDLYPMGEERAIVREVLGKLLPVTALPLEAGAIVINAETACRIQEAVDLKKPLIDKDITVAGKLKGEPIRIFPNVPIGTRVGALIERAGGLIPDCGELIMGGPFTGKRTDADAYVVKTTGGIIAAECFPKGPRKIGLLVCACGANRERLEELAQSLGSEVVGIEYCKQAHEVKGNLKCENPGRCPGQVQKVMALKKVGAEAVLISNCSDCSNTVMSCAPRLGLPVYHCTDGALRAVNHRLIRKLHNT